MKPFQYRKQLGSHYLVYQHHYFGLLDSTGHQLVPCRFDDIDRFYDGMAEVVLGGKHGYVDTTGKLIIPLLYVRAEPFYKGEALVVTAEGDIGYLNKKGEPVQPFSQLGRPYFKNKYTKSWACQPYISCTREGVGDFYISGESPGVDYVADVRQSTQLFRRTGLTIVFDGYGRQGGYGLADSGGHLIVPVVFEDANDTQYKWRDWIRVRKHGKYGFVNRQTGKTMIPLLYEDSKPSGLNIVWVKKNNKWGCIDRTGKIVVPFQYKGVSAYVEYRAIVRLENRLGYVDTTGKVVVGLQYDQAAYFHQGEARVYKDNRWVDLDYNGVVIRDGLRTEIVWDYLKYGVSFGIGMIFVLYALRQRLTIFH